MKTLYNPSNSPFHPSLISLTSPYHTAGYGQQQQQQQQPPYHNPQHPEYTHQPPQHYQYDNRLYSPQQSYPHQHDPSSQAPLVGSSKSATSRASQYHNPPQSLEYASPTAQYGSSQYAITSSAAPSTYQAAPLAEDQLSHDVELMQGEDGLDEEPLYVNAKQYHRILKRRMARQRLEEIHKLSRDRKVSVPILGGAKHASVKFAQNVCRSITKHHPPAAVPARIAPSTCDAPA